MGVYFESKSQGMMRISIWNWTYFLGLFEQMSCIPKGLLREMQSCGNVPHVPADIAKKIAVEMKTLINKYGNNLPASSAPTATFGQSFLGFLTGEKGYSNNATQRPKGMPSDSTLVGFARFCEASGGFDVA